MGAATAKSPVKLPKAKEIASKLALILGIFGALPIKLIRFGSLMKR